MKWREENAVPMSECNVFSHKNELTSINHGNKNVFNFSCNCKLIKYSMELSELNHYHVISIKISHLLSINFLNRSQNLVK